MDEKSFNIRIPKKGARIALVVTVTALIVAPLTAIASHSFTDVPDSNIFHADIEWLKDAGVTKGCNPPANTEFCPKDAVSREAMAAFMHRLAQYIDAEDGTPAQADNADTLDGLDSTAFVGATVVRREAAAPSTGTAFGNSHFLDQSCNAGEVLLSGGPANIDDGTILLESFPIETNTWRVRILNDATLDEFSVVVLCASR